MNRFEKYERCSNACGIALKTGRLCRVYGRTVGHCRDCAFSTLERPKWLNELTGKVIGYRFGGTEEPYVVPIIESNDIMEATRQKGCPRTHPEATCQARYMRHIKLKLTNGVTYTIPKDVLLTCKHIQIAYSKWELPQGPCPRHLRRDLIFDRNREFLVGYSYIGMEDLHENVELHWFVRKFELHKCRCDLT